MKKHRSAKSGQYVSSEEAKANPDSTVAETEGGCRIHRTDAERDYGNCGYQNRCVECGTLFEGHKREFVCPKCIRIAEAKEAVCDVAKKWCQGLTGAGPLMKAVDALIKAEQA